MGNSCTHAADAVAHLVTEDEIKEAVRSIEEWQAAQSQAAKAGGTMQGNHGPLLQRVGGIDVVKQVVELFYRKLYADPRLITFLHDQDVMHLRAKQSAFVSWLFGPPNVPYLGRSVRIAHLRIIKQRGFSPEDFDQGMTYFEQAMAELGAPEVIIGEVMRRMRPFKDAFFTPSAKDAEEEARWVAEERALKAEAARLEQQQQQQPQSQDQQERSLQPQTTLSRQEQQQQQQLAASGVVTEPTTATPLLAGDRPASSASALQRPMSSQCPFTGARLSRPASRAAPDTAAAAAGAAPSASPAPSRPASALPPAAATPATQAAAAAAAALVAPPAVLSRAVTPQVAAEAVPTAGSIKRVASPSNILLDAPLPPAVDGGAAAVVNTAPAAGQVASSRPGSQPASSSAAAAATRPSPTTPAAAAALAAAATVAAAAADPLSEFEAAMAAIETACSDSGGPAAGRGPEGSEGSAVALLGASLEASASVRQTAAVC